MAVARAETEEAGQRVVGVVLQVLPLLLGVVEVRARFQQEDIQPACRQLLGNDRAAAARADDDHVAWHYSVTSVRPW